MEAEKRRRLFAVLLPRSEYTTAEAIYDSNWKLSPAHKIFEILQNIWLGVPISWSLEVFSHAGTATLCFSTSSFCVEVMRASLHSVRSDCEIIEIPDYYDSFSADAVIGTSTLTYGNWNIYPTDMYREMIADPFISILNSIHQIDPKLKVIFQVATRSMRNDYEAYVPLFFWRFVDRWVSWLWPKFWFKPEIREEQKKKAFQKSASKLTNSEIRITVAADDEDTLIDRDAARKKIDRALDSVFGAVTVQNNPNTQWYRVYSKEWGPQSIKLARERKVRLLNPRMHMSANEIPGLWHLPDLEDAEFLKQVPSRRQSPAHNIPVDRADKEVSFIGRTNYRMRQFDFGIHRDDRKQHLLVAGSSGTGKTRLLETLAADDLRRGYGFGIVDLRGSLYDRILSRIPEDRIQDVVLFDPSDVEYPAALNPFEATGESTRIQIAMSVVEVFRRLHRDEWNDSIEHLLLYSVLALLSTKFTTVLSIRRLLTELEYREELLDQIGDVNVRRFFQFGYRFWLERYRDDAIDPLLEMIDQFVENELVYNCLGQPTDSFNFRNFMDEGKIVLVKLDEKVLGARNAAVLGGMIVNRFFQAAIGRSDVPIPDRKVFNLYIDEFERFATGSFEEILSESRKFGLNLTLSNRSFGELPEKVRKTLFANIGNLITLKSEPDDARVFAKELGPRISAEDLMYLEPHEFFIRMSVRYKAQETFSASTIKLREPKESAAAACIAHSREQFCSPRSTAEEVIERWGQVG